MRRAGLWKIYFWLYLLLGLASIPALAQLKLPFQIIRSTILWFPAAIGLYLFVNEKKKYFPLFWKVYFVYYLADIVYEWFWLRHFLYFKIDANIAIIVIVYLAELFILIPSIIALYNCAKKG